MATTTLSSYNWTETFTLAGIRERERRAHHDPKAAAVQQQEPNNNTMAATTTLSSNYWTATAHHVMPTTAVQQQHSKYVYDDCGIKHRINPEDANELQPCEPWCTSCGYPPHICDPYFTKCTGTKLGHWIDEAAEAEAAEEERWNLHKYGLCPICKIGLDDKSEFTINYTQSTCGTIMCCDCDDKTQ